MCFPRFKIFDKLFGKETADEVSDIESFSENTTQSGSLFPQDDIDPNHDFDLPRPK